MALGNFTSIVVEFKSFTVGFQRRYYSGAVIMRGSRCLTEISLKVVCVWLWERRWSPLASHAHPLLLQCVLWKVQWLHEQASCLVSELTNSNEFSRFLWLFETGHAFWFLLIFFSRLFVSSLGCFFMIKSCGQGFLQLW